MIYLCIFFKENILVIITIVFDNLIINNNNPWHTDPQTQENLNKVINYIKDDVIHK